MPSFTDTLYSFPAETHQRVGSPFSHAMSPFPFFPQPIFVKHHHRPKLYPTNLIFNSFLPHRSGFRLRPRFHPLALNSFHGCRFLKVRASLHAAVSHRSLASYMVIHRACLSCILCNPFPRCSASAFPTPTLASFAKTLACLNPTTKCSGCDSMQHSLIPMSVASSIQFQ